MVNLTCPVDEETGLCSLMEETGTGLAIFIDKLGDALPKLLIILGIVAIVVAIGMAIAGVIKKHVAKH
jgi:hypothetical protein